MLYKPTYQQFSATQLSENKEKMESKELPNLINENQQLKVPQFMVNFILRIM